MNEKTTASMFKALSDENRIRILDQLSAGEQCACRLLEDMHITQPTLSHHMKILCEAGVVTSRKEGKWMYYSISWPWIMQAVDVLQKMMPPDAEPGHRAQ